jgi:MoxR-like ATPase
VPFASPEDLAAALSAESYLPDHSLAVSLYLALAMRRPLLLEGEPGVGKTEVARTLARTLGAELIRLQCYEGIDASQALYEWDYARQLLYARLLQAEDADPDAAVDELYGPRFLVERPVLAAVRAGSRAVLLVDELDRADDEFEAFLLEALADSSVTIPEIGRVGAEDGSRPAVIITSNRTRELHDALKRRCLYHWIDYPDHAREAAIIRIRVPAASDRLARSIATAVARLRTMELVKPPGAAEAIDWAESLAVLGRDELDEETARATLGWAVKSHEDVQAVEARISELLQ